MRRGLPGLLLFLLCTSCSGATGAVLTSEQYARVLTQTAQRVEQAGGRAEATRALDALPARVTVPAELGRPSPQASNADLIAALQSRVEAGPIGRREAGQVLRNLARTVSAHQDPPPQEASQVLATVLAGREFRKPWWEDTSRRFWAWVQRVFTALAKRLHWPDWGLHLPKFNLHLPPDVWRAIGVALIVLLAGAVIFLLAKLLAQMAEPLTDLPPPPRVRQIEILSSLRWRAEAERAVQAGDYRAAVRALHLAALMRLDEAGLVRFDYACSDGRFVNLLRSGGQSDLAQQLLQLNRLFAMIWYGLAPAGEKEYAAAEALLGKLEAVTTP